tara:strand:- start:967 stop:1452 length:486 start_codon:yes stop_codon:yes gene_type:complete
MPDYLKKSFFINLLIIIIIFSLDRVSKFYVILNSESNLSPSLFTSKFLNINLIWNEGIAFGLLSFDQKLYYNLLTVVILIITAIILWMVSRSKGMEKIAFLIVLGGSLGNIFDRVLYKSVPDFIDFHINNFHWFIFNVADIFITLGVILLIYLELIVKTKK